MAARKGFHIPNPHVLDMEEDVLYHLSLDSRTNDFPAMFSDVKFVCMGGSANRMKGMADYLQDQLHVEIPVGMELCNMGKGKARYAIYKVGPVLCVSHGMGVPSLSILLHELFKLLFHAKCKDVTVIRIGTSGGIGLDPGTVVVTDEALNTYLKPFHTQVILGKEVHRPCILDRNIAEAIQKCSSGTDDFKTVLGKTMCANDFYEEQARLDGAVCSFTEEEKMAYLHNLYTHGVRNIEMESVAFAAMCHQVNVKGAVVCVTLVNRLDGDQVTASSESMRDWQMRPQRIVARYIRKQLGLD